MDIITTILKDLKVELLDKFDRNFSKGAFFSKKWPPRRDGTATHLNNTGTLRRSIKANIHGDCITFTSSTPYSSIHNEGGTITVTSRMKKYFWAMFQKTKKKEYKYMALMKVGSKITIPQRQFLGPYNGMDKTIERIAKHAIEEELRKMTDKNK